MLVGEGQEDPLAPIVRVDGVCSARLPVLQDVRPQFRAVAAQAINTARILPMPVG